MKTILHQKKHSTLHNWIFALLMLFTYIIMGISVITAMDSTDKPFPGFVHIDMHNGSLFISALNQPYWTGFSSGLKFQDSIIKINGESFKNSKTLDEVVKSSPEGTPISYEVWRNGESIQLEVPTSRYNWTDFWLVFGLTFSAAFVLTDMALIVYILRPFNSGTWAFIIFCLNFSVYCMTGYLANMNSNYVLLFYASSSILPVTILHLAARFPKENPFCASHKQLIPLAYIFAPLIGLLPSFIDWNTPELVGYILILNVLVTIISALYFFGWMFHMYRSYGHSGELNVTSVKIRLKVLLSGAIIAFGVPIALAVLTVSLDNFFIPFNYLSPIFLIFPICVAFTIVQYNLFSVDRYVKQAIALFLFVGTTTSFYFLIIIALEQLGISEVENSPFFTIGFTFLIVALFSPMNQALKRIVELWLSKNKKSYEQVVNEIGKKLSSVHTRDEIIDEILALLMDDLKIQSVSIWLKSGEEFSRCYQKEHSHSSESSKIPEHINERLKGVKRWEPLFYTEVMESNKISTEEREQYIEIFHALKATLLLPLVSQDSLRGMIIMGEKSDGQAYTSDDLYMLKPLTYQIAIALENAAFYEEIKLWNENLEHKVEERTQALQEALDAKEKTQQMLIRSESLAAIGQLVAGVAHELNNPLGSAHSLVQSAIEIMEEQEELNSDEEDVVDDLKFVLKEQTRAKNIVASLLDLSRQTQSYEEPVDLNQVINDSIRILYNKYKYRDATIKRQLSEDLPTINGNFAQLGQVCINIIQNAIQATPEKEGQITLETGVKNAQLFFKCIDNGPGIDKDNLKDIFKPFFTTKPVGVGTGLGLYICHDIVLKHQGEIHVYNNDTQGATFEIILPLAA